MKSFAVVLTLMMVIGLSGISSAQSTDKSAKIPPPSSQSAITFRLALRELWQYQVTWMRSYIVSTLADLEDRDIVKDKLIKNQEKIGNAVKPYYGIIAGRRLASLLREHILIAIEIVRAKKEKDGQALKEAREKGRQYAERISNLFGRVKSPVWDKEHLQEMFYKHLEYIDRQVDFRLQKEWMSEIKAYDDGLAHVLWLSDVLAESIVRQFPDKFKQ